MAKATFTKSAKPVVRNNSTAKPVGSAISFTAQLQRPAEPAGASWTFLNLPKQASARLPSRGQETVEGTLNGASFLATLEPDGSGGHWLKVERKLREARPDYKVVNASVSGETTAGGRARIEQALKMHRPGLVILALGANDGLRGYPIDALRANLEAIIETCRRHKAQVLLVGMQLPPNYGPAYTGKFRTAFAEIARKHALPSVPFLLEGFAEKREYFQDDGLHPSASMYTLWTAQALPVARSLLQR